MCTENVQIIEERKGETSLCQYNKFFHRKLTHSPKFLSDDDKHMQTHSFTPSD